MKSSFSNGSGGNNCVDIDFTEDSVQVRDTKEKDLSTQQVLVFTREEWDAFLKGVKAGEFDIPNPA